MSRNRTYRDVDGERIEGTWRPIFIRNGSSYFLSELKIYADGAIWCWEWVDLDGLREKLRSGWVATKLEPGGQASAHHLATWRFDDPQVWITAEDLLGEVADEIDRLNDRPDSTGRCLLALERFLQTRAEADRVALRATYQAIPEHLRVYALGDMDYRDVPLRVLCADLGEPLEDYAVAELEDEADGDGPLIVTEKERQWAIEYFTERDRDLQAARERPHADGPDGADSPTLYLHHGHFGKLERTDTDRMLRNEYPTPIVVASVTYPTVAHAYWALSTTDPAAREQIRAAEAPHQAEELARQATRRTNWPAIRPAVMADLLRAKYDQHPDLAEALIATGDARIHYGPPGSDYWHAGSPQGRNWIGRLLELVRAELVASREGIHLI
ncbi:NADAR family protein [Planotetraspora sp. GP83]|uniref:NADAR family protein n=1 Tax=Planotetraspora sp. GP83 TaxID=3156264 RepID=UPI0035197954